jgi:hypothetical protein
MQPEIRLLRLLSTFLTEHPHPLRSDWLALVDANPELQADIVDFACSYAATGNVDARQLPSGW